MKIKIQTNKKIAQELAAYMQQRGIEPEVQVEGQNTLVIADIDKEEDMYRIKRKYKVLKVESGADKVVGATDETLKFVTEIIAPVVKTGARTAGSLIKATARTGSTLVTEVIKSAKDTAEEIKQDKNAQVIKKELSKAKGFFAGLRDRKKKKDAFEIIE